MKNRKVELLGRDKNQQLIKYNEKILKREREILKRNNINNLINNN